MPWKQTLKSIAVLVLVLLLVPAVSFANPPAQSSSSSYQLDEVFFGSGGELNACSTSYCSKQSAGEVTVGKTCGTAFCAQGGFNTDRTPYLEVDVNNTNINVGTLTASGTKTANATFSVKAYLAHGYSVVTASPPPTNGSYTMHTDSSPTASSSGTEQFGINLVHNTSPTTYGTNPAQVPDSTFGFGDVDANYGTANSYKYQQGDRIAFSDKSTSFTDYTISYIFNISNITPGGTYTMQHVLVVTGTY